MSSPQRPCPAPPAPREPPRSGVGVVAVGPETSSPQNMGVSQSREARGARGACPSAQPPNAGGACSPPGRRRLWEEARRLLSWGLLRRPLPRPPPPHRPECGLSDRPRPRPRPRLPRPPPRLRPPLLAEGGRIPSQVPSSIRAEPGLLQGGEARGVTVTESAATAAADLLAVTASDLAPPPWLWVAAPTAPVTSGPPLDREHPPPAPVSSEHSPVPLLPRVKRSPDSSSSSSSSASASARLASSSRNTTGSATKPPGRSSSGISQGPPVASPKPNPPPPPPGGYPPC